MMTDTISVAPELDRDLSTDTDTLHEMVQLTEVPAPLPATRAAARATNARRPQLSFRFDGTPGEWFGVWVAAFFTTVFTLGVCYPWALVKTADWRTSHTLIDGQRLRFTGAARELFPRWVAWLLLSVVTIGVYSFWARTRVAVWVVEHQELDNAL